MKRIIYGILILVCSTTIFAANDFTPFTTIDQAKQYCPAINALTFTPVNPSLPNSKGSVTGINQVNFESIPAQSAIHPQNLDSSGLILDAQFRMTSEGWYGYNSNNVITCFYSYTTYAGVSYNLILRSK